MSSTTGFLTGGLIDPSTNFANDAIKNEKQRKGKIEQGLSNINAVFGGGNTSIYTPVLDKFGSGPNQIDNSVPYYSQNKVGKYKPYLMPGWSPKGIDVSGPMPGDFGGNFAANILGGLFGGEEKAPTYKELLNKQIKGGNLYTKQDKTFTGFGNDFFNQASQDYIDFALPQLSRDYRNTSDAVTYGLANRGLMNSSAAEKARSDLAITAGQQRQQVADTGRTTAQNLRRQVEQARQEAIAQLYNTADPAQGLQSAVSSAAGFQVPQTFAPLANAFSGIVNQYATSRLLNNYQPMGYTSQFGQSPNIGALGDITL